MAQLSTLVPPPALEQLGHWGMHNVWVLILLVIVLALVVPLAYIWSRGDTRRDHRPTYPER